MADGSANINNGHQSVKFFRWIDNKLQVQEEFISLEQLPKQSPIRLLTYFIYYTVMSLKIENARGQCYVGVATTSGTK